MFEVDELEIICQKSGYLSELSANTRHHFHCVVSGQSFEEVESHFSNDNFHVSDCGDFEDNLVSLIINGSFLYSSHYKHA